MSSLFVGFIRHSAGFFPTGNHPKTLGNATRGRRSCARHWHRQTSPSPVIVRHHSQNLYGLPPSNLSGMATTSCIFQLIPYINALIGYTIITPIFIGQMQSSVNQLVTTSATTAQRATLPTLPSAPGMPGWAIALVVCSILLIPAILAAMLLPALARAKYRAQEISCMNNMKQIGLSFRTWAIDRSEESRV